MQAHEQGVAAEKILEVASRLFAQKGYANASIRDICKETGTTAPVIYYHFGSKKGLFDAVARSKISMRDFIVKLTKEASVSDPEEGLRAFIGTYLTSFPEHAFDPGLYMRESATLDKKSAQIVSHDLDKVNAIATGLIKRCVDAKAFRRTQAGLAADCLLGMLNRAIFQDIHFSKGSDRPSYGEFVSDFFFRAMR
ncbi:MAG: TetR/AcrR family transcriptional regulator [Thaumarchaeota archaeon]|nr:TetR/AcrR family transcriptional regulator [Nitrososphaerota archaeon]